MAFSYPDSRYISLRELLKLNLKLDTIWKRNYHTENFWTSFNMPGNKRQWICIRLEVLRHTEESYWDALLLKTDSMVNTCGIRHMEVHYKKKAKLSLKPLMAVTLSEDSGTIRQSITRWMHW